MNDELDKASELFNKYADSYQEKYMDVSLYQNSLDLFCQQIQIEHAAILELACGPGNITKYLLSKRSDFKILGIDLAPKMIELARINNPTADFKVMDGKKIAELNQKFDGVVCGFYLPYLSKEEIRELFQMVSNCLNPQGLFYLSTMEGPYEKSGPSVSSSGKDQLFTYYYPLDYLIKTLQEFGFEILDVQQLKNPLAQEEQSNDLSIVVQKQ